MTCPGQILQAPVRPLFVAFNTPALGDPPCLQPSDEPLIARVLVTELAVQHVSRLSTSMDRHSHAKVVHDNPASQSPCIRQTFCHDVR